MDMMSRTLIRGMSNKDEGQYVGYFLPNKETLCRRRRDTNEGADQLCVYNPAQEYNWQVKKKDRKDYEGKHLFVFRDGAGVYYDALETKLWVKGRDPTRSTGIYFPFE